MGVWDFIWLKRNKKISGDMDVNGDGGNMSLEDSMKNKIEPAHQCAESLENKMSVCCDNGLWYLSTLVRDLDCDTYYIDCIGIISYCPYCGKKLTVGNKRTGE